MAEPPITDADRLAIRARPEGWPVMYQSWGKLLFMHWRFPAELLRPLIPARLTIDTFDDTAWVGVVPFTMWGIRPIFLPALPWVSEAHELNVRTYVHLDGVPGVWFFSLDINHLLGVWAARLGYHLPYFLATVSLQQQGQTIDYRLRRTHADAPKAEFEATWHIGEPLPPAAPGTLDFFLTERYCLYAAEGSSLYRARIWHRPYPLQQARLSAYRSTMIESHGLTAPGGEPLLHYAESVEVEVWPPARV